MDCLIYIVIIILQFSVGIVLGLHEPNLSRGRFYFSMVLHLELMLDQY